MKITSTLNYPNIVLQIKIIFLKKKEKILFPLIKKTLKKFPKKKIPQSFHVDLAFTDSLLMSKLN